MIFSMMFSSILPIIVMDVSGIEAIDVSDEPVSTKSIQLRNKEGGVEHFRAISASQGMLFIGQNYECFESMEQIAFAFHPTLNATTAAQALQLLASKDADELNIDTSPLYSHLQIWVDKDGSGECTFDEVYSVAELNVRFDLESINNDDFNYGKGWSLNAKMSYIYEYIDNYGKLTESTPQDAYSVILESL